MSELNMDPNVWTATVLLSEAAALLQALGINNDPRVPDVVREFQNEFIARKFSATLTGDYPEYLQALSDELAKITLERVEALVREAHELVDAEYDSSNYGIASCDHEECKQMREAADDFHLWEEEIKADGFTVLEEGDDE